MITDIAPVKIEVHTLHVSRTGYSEQTHYEGVQGSISGAVRFLSTRANTSSTRIHEIRYSILALLRDFPQPLKKNVGLVPRSIIHKYPLVFHSSVHNLNSLYSVVR